MLKQITPNLKLTEAKLGKPGPLHTTHTGQPIHYNLFKAFGLLLKIKDTKNISNIKNIKCISSADWILNPSEKLGLLYSL